MIDTKPFNPAWAARLTAAFDASGIHRVGTPGDFACGAWFEREAAAPGIAVTRMPVPLQRTIIEEAYVECGGMRIDGLPLVDAPSCAGVSGTLSASGGAGDIGLAEFPSNAASIKGQPLEKLRRSTRHKALIVATRVTGDSLAPINAQFYDTPFGPPLLQVAGIHHALLAEQAAKNAAVKFVSRYRREAIDSFNLEARAVSGGSSSPLAIVTPRTGWWESTAERAGGMVAWLAAMHAAGQLKQSGQLNRDVLAWATCGHEHYPVPLLAAWRRHAKRYTGKVEGSQRGTGFERYETISAVRARRVCAPRRWQQQS